MDTSTLDKFLKTNYFVGLRWDGTGLTTWDDRGVPFHVNNFSEDTGTFVAFRNTQRALEGQKPFTHRLNG